MFLPLGREFHLALARSIDVRQHEAYIASQKHVGWICLPEHYDEGGFSGGNIDRPAFIAFLRMASGSPGYLDHRCDTGPDGFRQVRPSLHHLGQTGITEAVVCNNCCALRCA